MSFFFHNKCFFNKIEHRKDCKLINLKYEYNGYTGDEKWAIITELSVKELWEKYPLVIERYSPFVHLSIAQGEVINDANRNEDKYAKRSSRTLDCYGYDDEMSSQFHKELTSVIKKRYLPSHIILGEEFGLKKPSMVLLEQIRTVNREDLREYIGTVDDDKLFRQINATLKKTFGLWVYKPEGKENIRCLCPKCLNDYIHNPDYIVRRLDPFAKRKDRCDKCDGDGWDYVVTDRYSSKKEKRCKNV